MPELIGLTGAQLEKTPALFIYKPTDIECILKNGYAATAANNNGALNVWEDTDNKIRCERMRSFCVKDSQIFDSWKEAISWTRKALRLIK